MYISIFMNANLLMPPRAQLIMRTPFLHLAKDSSFNRLLVSGVSGVCTVMKSASFQICSTLTAWVMLLAANPSLLITGS